MTLYRKEVVDLGGKLTRLVADGTEEWDIKNMVYLYDLAFYSATLMTVTNVETDD